MHIQDYHDIQASDDIASTNYNIVDYVNKTFDMSIRTKIHLDSNQKICMSPNMHNICLNINSKVLRQIIDDNYTGIIQATQISIKNQSIVLSNFKQKQYSNNQQQSYQIYISDKKVSQILYKKFIASLTNNQLILQLRNHQQLQINIFPVKKFKFAKTATLQQTINHSYDIHTVEYGILSMDQSGRILVENSQCQFPAIGIWCKCQKIDHILIYNQITQYLYEKRKQKCCFMSNSTKYIYYANINADIPELYYVAWNMHEDNHHVSKIVKRIGQNDEDVVIELGKQYLEFTLRGNQDAYQSPHKNITNQQVSQQLQKLCFNSPGFSSIKKDTQKQQLKVECQYLRQKVTYQQKIIINLQKQMQQMAMQLQHIRKSINNQTPQHKKKIDNIKFMKSPDYIQNSSTPQAKFKKLSESDLYHSGFFSASSQHQKQTLKSNSRNTKDTKGNQSNDRTSLNSSSGKQLEFKDSRKRKISQISEVDGEDPWDFMEIIE